MKSVKIQIPVIEVLEGLPVFQRAAGEDPADKYLKAHALQLVLIFIGQIG